MWVKPYFDRSQTVLRSCLWTVEVRFNYGRTMVYLCVIPGYNVVEIKIPRAELPRDNKIKGTEKSERLLFLFKHQLLHFCCVFFFFFKIEHCSEYMIPDGGAYAKAIVLVFIVMQVMISP